MDQLTLLRADGRRGIMRDNKMWVGVCVQVCVQVCVCEYDYTKEEECHNLLLDGLSDELQTWYVHVGCLGMGYSVSPTDQASQVMKMKNTLCLNARVMKLPYMYRRQIQNFF